MDHYNHFKIIDNDTYFTVVNKKANDFDNYHTHLNKRSMKNNRNVSRKNQDSTCQLLIRLVCEKTVPKSDYLKRSAKRIARDSKYIQAIDHKYDKDKDKLQFHKQPRGFF